jgi:putative DNA primase/helicase
MTANRDVLPSAYIEAALQNECRTVSGTPAGKGLRNRLLNSAAFNLGRLVPGGLDETLAIDRLVAAARANGYASEHGGVATLAVIRSGINAGKAEPRRRTPRNQRRENSRMSKRPDNVVRFPGSKAVLEVAAVASPAVAQCFAEIPTQTPGTEFVAGGDEGPGRQPGELRRHFYRRGNMVMRCKIKRSNGGFVDWYRVRDADNSNGWQPKKPEGYVTVPYFGALDPFDVELLADDICWPEGEKDCDTLAQLGIPAFTFGGASDVPSVAAEYLKGRNVVILADNDEPGRECAEKKAMLAHAVAASVRVVQFPELSEKQDVSDWIATGHSADNLRVRIARVDCWQPNPPPQSLGVIIQCAADILPEKIEWLWPGRAAVGKLTLIGGAPGLGKSQCHAFMCAAVSTGGDWPCGEGRAPLGNAIVLSAEDGAKDTIVPRLISVGADLSRVHIVSGMRDERGRRTFNLKADISALEEKVRAIGDVRLIIIDPISAYMGGADGNGNTETREVLEPIAEMADRLRIAVVCITHLNKGGGGGKQSALNRFVGSIAFTAAARAAFAVIEDSDDETRRLFLQVKNNLGKSCAGLAFRIEQALIPGNIVASRICWDTDPVAVDVNTALAASEAADGGGRTSKDEAADFLQKLLAAGPLPVKEIEAQAVEAGLLGEGKPIGQNKAFRAARDSLQIAANRAGGLGGQGRWEWVLPEAPKMPIANYDAPSRAQDTLGILASDGCVS